MENTNNADSHSEEWKDTDSTSQSSASSAEELEYVGDDGAVIDDDEKTSRGGLRREADNGGCGCGGCAASCSTPLVICILILACFSAFVVDRCSPDTLAERSSNSVAKLMERLKLGVPSEKIFTGGVIVNNVSGEDKYVAAQIDETVSSSCERSNFKLTATYRISARANFEYYVNLSKFKLRFDYAPNGKIRAVADFGELKLGEPVAYKVLKQESSVRPFVVDFDSMQSAFMRDEFPKFLAEEGSNMKSQLAARFMAQKSLERLVRTKVFPLLNIDRKFAEENISEVVINFGSENLSAEGDAASVNINLK